MRRINLFSLWLGNVGDLRDPAKLYEAQIRAVVDLAANEPFPQLPRELMYVRVPLVDGSGNDPALVRLAVRTTAQLLSEGIPTLVCCSNGLSRSPAIAAAAVHAVQERPLHDCLLLVTAQGHDVSPALWQEVESACLP